MNIESRWIVLLALGVLLVACTTPGEPAVGQPTATTAAEPTATLTADPTATMTPEPATGKPPLDAGMIAGRVFHDLCAIAGGEGGAPAVPSDGCVPAGGGYQANGLLDAGEPGIEGVVVTLGAGECPAAGLATATTGPDGSYVFNDLEAGTYCVAVDPLTEPNTSILVPGGWTAPAVDQGSVTVALDPGMQRTGIDLGWDYQFLPADESGAFAAWLKENIAARDYAELESLMADPFGIAAWRSEGQFYSPAEAIEQLRMDHLGPDVRVSYPEPDITTLLGGADPYAIFGPDVRIVRIVFAQDWGMEGNQALLYISQEPDGTYRWVGVLTAFGGFEGTAATCPAAGADQASLVNEEHNYCLLYPADFEVHRPVDYETVLLGPVPIGDRAIAYIEVVDVPGQTTEQAADAVVTERTSGMPGFNIERQEIILDGEPAVLLDGLPGQDSTRMIVVVHDGRLYRLSFMPSNPNLPEPYADMERLYTLLLDTFQFIR